MVEKSQDLEAKQVAKEGPEEEEQQDSTVDTTASTEEKKASDAKAAARSIISEMEAELENQKQIDKCRRFTLWCKENGVVMPKLEYPAFFEGGLCGVKVKEEIKHNEAFLYVPQSVQMTLAGAKKVKDLKPIYDSDPELFDDEESGGAEHNILITYVLYEMQKGKDSFWHPYFEVLPKVTNFWHWNLDDIKATEDLYLIKDYYRQQKLMKENWTELSDCYAKFPHVFEQGFVTKELFEFVSVNVGTRVFGWNLPQTAMIPMADALNHSHIDVQYEIMNKKYHPKGEDAPAQYFKRQKYFYDYSAAFQAADPSYQSKYSEAELQNIKGRFNAKNFEINQERFTSSKHFAECMKLGARIWDVPCLRRYYNEDNDDDSSDSDSDEESKASIDSTIHEEILKKAGKVAAKCNNLLYFAELELFSIRRKELKDAQERERIQELDQDGNTVSDMKLPQLDYKPITKAKCARNEYLVVGAEKQPKPLTQMVDDPLTRKGDGEDDDDDVSSDEEFDWYNGQKDPSLETDTYFCLVNMDRKPMKKGEEAFNCYGNRSNRYLLSEYGFAFEGNNYDSFTLFMIMSIDIQKLQVPEMVEFVPIKALCQIVRLKKDQICGTLVHYLRSVCKQSFFEKNTTLLGVSPSQIMLTRPVDVLFEVFVFSYYKKVLEWVKVVTEQENTLESDLEQLKKTDLDWNLRMAIVYRSGRKQIIRSQLHLIEKVLCDLENTVRMIAAKADLNPDVFQTFIMKRTQQEEDEEARSKAIKDEAERESQLQSIEQAYWYRRLINADYYKYIHRILF